MTKQISIFRTNIRHCLTETPNDAQSEKRLRFTENLYFYTFGSAAIRRETKNHTTDTQRRNRHKNALPSTRLTHRTCVNRTKNNHV